jgi:hypothetical protein
MKRLFIEENGQDQFDNTFPTGSMNLVWMSNQWELHTSKALFHLFKEDIEAGKASRSWLCIRVDSNALSFHVQPSQSVVDLVAEIGMSSECNEKAMSICKKFDPNVSIPVMIVAEAPEFRRIAMQVFFLPW